MWCTGARNVDSEQTLLPHFARKSGLVRKREKRRGKGRSFYVSAATFHNKAAHVPTAYTHIVMHFYGVNFFCGITVVSCENENFSSK